MVRQADTNIIPDLGYSRVSLTLHHIKNLLQVGITACDTDTLVFSFTSACHKFRLFVIRGRQIDRTESRRTLAVAPLRHGTKPGRCRGQMTTTARHQSAAFDDVDRRRRRRRICPRPWSVTLRPAVQGRPRPIIRRAGHQHFLPSMHINHTQQKLAAFAVQRTF